MKVTNEGGKKKRKKKKEKERKTERENVKMKDVKKEKEKRAKNCYDDVIHLLCPLQHWRHSVRGPSLQLPPVLNGGHEHNQPRVAQVPLLRLRQLAYLQQVAFRLGDVTQGLCDVEVG